MSDNDDTPIGRILTRREILGLFGAAGAALLVGCSDDDSGSSSSAGSPDASPTSRAQASGVTPSGTSVTSAATTPSCVVRPALTVGPYFVDEKLDRSDIRSDPSDGSVSAGVPLVLTINVSRMAGSSCSSLASATVDVWQCDGLGVYSDVADPSFNTQGKKFLRGYQTTNANGQVKFTTIYPGWYRGRATHIHFKIRSGSYDFTSQWFFDDNLSQEIYTTQAPYTQKGVNGRLLNANDSIYRESNGQLLLTTTKTSEGYAATFDVALTGI